MTRGDYFLGRRRRYSGRISTGAVLRHPKPAKEAAKP
jgi:hypothetical protein